MNHPTHIGKYLIRREIGQGAMGAVYEGFDPVIERQVAIKTILSQRLADGHSESAVARFQREARAGGRLQHPGIVAVYEYGEANGMAYIVMEYVEGEDLRHLLRRKRQLELIDIYGLTRQLLTALGYSHQQGVVHRDIKPANMMVLHGLKLKVMDFGIARLHSSSLTQVGSIMGTPTHMAPEQLMGHVADGRADLWSVGVILYELLTGRTPFAAETPAAVMHHVLHAEPALPSRLNPRIAHAFDAVVARALAKKPQDRFQTAAEFSSALLAAFRGRPAAEAVPPAQHDETLSMEQTVRFEHTGTVGASKHLDPLSATLPPQTLAQIEASLTRVIGPMAKQVVRQGVTQSRSVDEFFSLLASNVPHGAERDEFLSRIRQLDTGEAMTAVPAPASASGNRSAGGGHAGSGAGGAGAAPQAPFDSATLSRCERHLSRHVGPLAKLLIKRAANDSGNVAELVGRLAEHIDDESDRQEFLKAMG